MSNSTVGNGLVTKSPRETLELYTFQLFSLTANGMAWLKKSQKNLSKVGFDPATLRMQVYHATTRVTGQT